jgi:polynucleotide 5'-triphosphatase
MQHKHFNQMLNQLMLQPPPTAASRIEYKHQYLVDSFFPSDSGDGEKIRVQRDEKTKEVLHCMKKIRLGTLEIFSPKRAADWRVSVNMEVPGVFLFGLLKGLCN